MLYEQAFSRRASPSVGRRREEFSFHFGNPQMPYSSRSSGGL
jgi:hypothetical protein